MEEIWKDVINYEGRYKVSSLGRVKSLKRNRITERVLSPVLGSVGYLQVNLYNNFGQKQHRIHQLVAEAFLNHTRCGRELVVNHINNVKTDNCLRNLEIITTRENTNKKHLKSTSKHTGVTWRNDVKKWQSYIYFQKKLIHLGYFINELDASNAYQTALKQITT